MYSVSEVSWVYSSWCKFPSLKRSSLWGRIERPPPLYGVQNGDLELGGVEEVGEGGGGATDCMRGGGGGGGAKRERQSERKEGERNSVLFKWIQSAERKRDTYWETERKQAKKKVETDLLYAREKQGNEWKKGKGGKRKRGIGFFSSNLASFTLMTQIGFQLNSPGREELMVSFRGSRAEGRNLNALGWTMPALWIITLAITLNQGERCYTHSACLGSLKFLFNGWIFSPFTLLARVVCGCLCALWVSFCAGSACVLSFKCLEMCVSVSVRVGACKCVILL